MYESHTMKCEPPSGFPNATVEWRHNGVKVINKQYEVDIVKFEQQSLIRFGRVTWDNRGQYTCIATNSEQTRTSPIADLTVQGMIQNSHSSFHHVSYFAHM